MATETVILDLDERPAWATRGVRVGRCAGCSSLHVLARRYDPARPWRMVAALAVFRVLGRPLPDPERTPAGEIARWVGRFAPLWSTALTNGTEDPATAAAEPWAHIDPAGRALMVQQFTRWVHTRARPGGPLTITAPPPGACLLCGVGHLQIPPELAHQIPPSLLWAPLTADPGSLGGKGGSRVTGALCPACDRACTDAELGARVLGDTARESALATFWESTGRDSEARMIRSGELGPPPGWAVLGLPPGRVPWEHIEPPELG